MRKENLTENRYRKIESQLSQIRILLISLIVLCLLGFYGPPPIVHVAGGIFRVVFWLLVFVAVVYPVCWFIEKRTMREQNRINEELKKIIDNAESDKEKPESRAQE